MISACLIKSPIWDKLKKLNLSKNMRVRLDPTFMEFLLKTRDRTINTETNDLVKIPPSILVSHTNESDALQKLIQMVYPKITNGSQIAHSSLNRAILTTKYPFVDEINDALIDGYPGEAVQYLSYDETLNENHQAAYVDLLNILTPSVLPSHRLVLKSNTPIILLRNLDPTEKLCNGTRFAVKSLSKNIIDATISFGEFSRQDVFIHRIWFNHWW